MIIIDDRIHIKVPFNSMECGTTFQLPEGYEVENNKVDSNVVFMKLIYGAINLATGICIDEEVLEKVKCIPVDVELHIVDDNF